MAIIYDLFTGKVLAVNPESTVDNTTSYQTVKDRIEARFGDNLPTHFKKYMSVPQKRPYMCGDVHNVQYRSRTIHFNKPFPVPCEVTIGSCKQVNGVLTLGAACVNGIDEPFPWMDHKYQVSLNFLRNLPNETKLVIYTRSDLIAHDDYVSELKRLKAIVIILCSSDNEELNRINEPGAPSLARRMKAIDRLRECGINCRLEKHDIPNKNKAIA